MAVAVFVLGRGVIEGSGIAVEAVMVGLGRDVPEVQPSKMKIIKMANEEILMDCMIIRPVVLRKSRSTIDEIGIYQGAQICIREVAEQLKKVIPIGLAMVELRQIRFQEGEKGFVTQHIPQFS